MGPARFAPKIWFVTALTGIALAALVWASWPEPTSSLEPAAEPPAPGLVAKEPSGPPPIPSESELQPDYVSESPEELGAEPLPGAVLTPEPPPVAD